ncbi:MAG: hypothetical protein QXD59_02960 [Candidatus Caldarchaeum sp.]
MAPALKRFGRVLLASIIATTATNIPDLLAPAPLPDPIKVALIPLITAAINAAAKKARLDAKMQDKSPNALARLF